MIKFLGLRATAFRYLTYEGSEDKKATQKKCVIKRRHKFDNYKNCLEATQLEKKYLENNKISIGSLNKCHK